MTTSTQVQKTEQEWRDDLKTRISNVSLDEFPAFAHEVMDAPHDYGSVCVAIGYLAAAAAWACNKEKNGGITGFQAGAVFWEFVRAWDPFLSDGPKRIVCYENMLYPQYDERFAQTISRDTWEWLQQEAAKRLAKSPASEAVEAHWQSIVDGVVPFGYTVER